jgi:hypothetical protein
LGRWPAFLLAAPLALAPAAAGAATITIGASCTLTGAGVCNATTKLTNPGDTIAFTGGVLTMNGSATYAQSATLTNSGGNTINQDEHVNTFSGVFANAPGKAGEITITNVNAGTGKALTTGSVTFSGINTYTGATTINTGATLALSGNGSIATSSGLADNGTFDISAAGGPVNVQDLTGSGAVNLGTNTVLLNTTANSTFSGTIGGSGSVTVTGSNKQTLTGSLGYTGATTVGAGATLAFGTAAANPTPTVASLAGGGTVSLANNQALKISNALTGAGSANTFSGTISGGNKSTSVTIAGGTESLMGNVTVSGATTVSAGATLTGTGSTAKNLVNNGTVKPFNTVTGKTGSFTVGTDYTQGATGLLDFAIGGSPGSGNYSTLRIGGAATLLGTLAVETVNNFLFPIGATAYDNIITYSSLLGFDFSAFTYKGKNCVANGVETWVCNHLTFQAVNVPALKEISLRINRAPEPGTLALLGTGLLGLFALRRRRA